MLLTPTLALRFAASLAMTGDNLLPFSFPAVSRKTSHSRIRRRTPHLGWRRDAAFNGRPAAFGLPGTKPLARKVDEAADALRTERALSGKTVVRGYAETRHRAKSWNCERRAVARIEATTPGLDIRFVVTNLDLYCAPGQAENLRPRSRRC